MQRPERGDAQRLERGDAQRSERNEAPRFDRDGDRAELPISPEMLEAAPVVTTAEAAAADFDQTGAERPQRRERRTRDLYGRDHRRGRGENGETSGESESHAQAPAEYAPQPAQDRAAGAESEPAPRSYFARRAAEEGPAIAAAAPEPVQQAVLAAPAAPVAEAPAVPAALPSVQSYALPEDHLAHVAQAAGLEWVGSDPGKVAAAQAAIAAEPQLAHVPRERPPVAAVQDEPLVLVETQQDLRAMPLPFERDTSNPHTYLDKV
jgi:ribonuclease E